MEKDQLVPCFPVLTTDFVFAICIIFSQKITVDSHHLDHQATYDATLLENTVTFIDLQCVNMCQPILKLSLDPCFVETFLEMFGTQILKDKLSVIRPVIVVDLRSIAALPRRKFMGSLRTFDQVQN